MNIDDVSPAPSPGDLRVWHVPQVPGQPFTVPVTSIAEGLALCSVLADYDLFQLEHRIKLDYANAQGVQRYEESGGNPGDPPFDWYDVEGDEERR